MGYISLLKSGSEVDLLPADNIMHVGAATATAIVLTYGIVGSGTTPSMVKATITYATTASVTEPNVRGLIVQAIESANGASGPGISVSLPTLVTEVAIAY